MTEKKPTLEYESPKAKRRKSPQVYIVAMVCGFLVFLISATAIGAVAEHVSKASDLTILVTGGVSIAAGCYTFFAVVRDHTDDGDA